MSIHTWSSLHTVAFVLCSSWSSYGSGQRVQSTSEPRQCCAHEEYRAPLKEVPGTSRSHGSLGRLKWSSLKKQADIPYSHEVLVMLLLLLRIPSVGWHLGGQSRDVTASSRSDRHASSSAASRTRPLAPESVDSPAALLCSRRAFSALVALGATAIWALPAANAAQPEYAFEYYVEKGLDKNRPDGPAVERPWQEILYEDAQPLKWLSESLALDKVVVFSAPECSDCLDVTKSLQSSGVQFTEVKLDTYYYKDMMLLAAVAYKAGSKEIDARSKASLNPMLTVNLPCVFIDGKFMGGAREVAALKATGKLATKFAAVR